MLIGAQLHLKDPKIPFHRFAVVALLNSSGLVALARVLQVIAGRQHSFVASEALVESPRGCVRDTLS